MKVNAINQMNQMNQMTVLVGVHIYMIRFQTKLKL